CDSCLSSSLFLLLSLPPPSSPLFPYTTLFRSYFHDTEATHAGMPASSFEAAASACVLTLARILSTNPHAGWADLPRAFAGATFRSEEHTSELQSRFDLVCRLLLETKTTNEDPI